MVTIKKYVAIFVMSLPCISFANIQELGRKLDNTYITTPNGTCGAYTALARPIINSCNECCGSNWFAGASLLYWNAVSCENNYAYRRTPPAVGPSVRGIGHDVHFDWNFGYRVLLGYNLAHDGWETGFIYTNFSVTGHDKAAISGCDPTNISIAEGAIVPSVGSPSVVGDGEGGTFGYALQACSKKKLIFRTLKWDLARDFFVSDCLSIRPCTALLSVWCDTKQSTRYSGGDPITQGDATVLGLGENAISIRSISRFRGIGPSFGVGLSWYMGCSMHLFTDLSTAILCGKFKVSERTKYNGSEPTPSGSSLKSSFRKFCSMKQAQVGLARKWYCNDDQNHVMTKLYFEVQQWQKLSYAFNWSTGSSFQRVQRMGNDVGVMGIGFDLRVDF